MKSSICFLLFLMIFVQSPSASMDDDAPFNTKDFRRSQMPSTRSDSEQSDEEFFGAREKAIENISNFTNYYIPKKKTPASIRRKERKLLEKKQNFRKRVVNATIQEALDDYHEQERIEDQVLHSDYEVDIELIDYPSDNGSYTSSQDDDEEEGYGGYDDYDDYKDQSDHNDSSRDHTSYDDSDESPDDQSVNLSDLNDYRTNRESLLAEKAHYHDQTEGASLAGVGKENLLKRLELLIKKERDTNLKGHYQYVLDLLRDLTFSQAKHSSALRTKARAADIKRAQEAAKNVQRKLMQYIDEHNLTFLLPSERKALQIKAEERRIQKLALENPTDDDEESVEPKQVTYKTIPSLRPGYCNKIPQHRIKSSQTKKLHKRADSQPISSPVIETKRKDNAFKKEPTIDIDFLPSPLFFEAQSFASRTRGLFCCMPLVFGEGFPLPRSFLRA